MNLVVKLPDGNLGLATSITVLTPQEALSLAEQLRREALASQVILGTGTPIVQIGKPNGNA